MSILQTLRRFLSGSSQSEYEMEQFARLNYVSEATRLRYLFKIHQIVNRTYDWSATYRKLTARFAGQSDPGSESSWSGVIDAICERMGTIDLITPAVQILANATIGSRNRRSLQVLDDSVPNDLRAAIIEMISSPQWDSQIRAVAIDCILYGTGFTHSYARDDGVVGIEQMPFYTAISIDPYDRETVIAARTAWVDREYGVIVRTIDALSDSFASESSALQPRTETNDFGFVPVSHVRNPMSLNVGSPYGMPMFATLADATMFVSGATNDAIFLMRALSHSLTYIIGADGDDITISPLSIMHVPDKEAKVGMLTPDAKITELGDFVQAYMRRSLGLSMIPPDIIESRSMSNTGSAAVTSLFESMKATVAQLRAALSELEQKAMSYCASMIARRASLSAFYSPADVRKVLRVVTGYESDIDQGVSMQEAEAYDILLKDYLVAFEKARRHFNPDEPEESIEEARQKWEEMMAQKASKWPNIA